MAITSPEDLGRTIRRYRKKRGLTQAEVGKKFNIRQASVSNLENGTPGISLDTMFSILSALSLEIHLEPRDKPSKHEALW